MKRSFVFVAVVGCFVGAYCLASLAGAQDPDSTGGESVDQKVDQAAVARAQKTVKMLDDIYKNAVVLITDKYVNSEDDFPAGSAAVALFSVITEKGWHKVRLIDVSGEPYNNSNVAKDDFEKAGVEKLRGGESYFEQVAEIEGEPYLRAMTAIPVVMEKCTMCHANYEEVPEGAAIGAISYSIPLE